ncbi:MAG: peptide ABC transporter substrate-binding protein [Candidatus Eremiobacteraeota bacterium]|nr:peptide ABC transporter substrate-binding protein [Candidatus Eremiobacteraeota bacterium]
MKRAVVFALLLAAVGCTRTNGTGGWGTPHELTIVRANDTPSLNPLFAFDQPDIDITQLYAEPLVGLSANNQLVPLVAARVPTVANGDVARDGRTVTYHLRHGVRFADGVALTSKDVAFTYRAILDPRNPVTEAQPYRIIDRLRTPDPYTVVLHFRRPWGAATAALFAVSDFIYGILPAHAFASTDLSHAAWNDRPFGSGPFRVVRWEHGDRIVLEPNPYAWRKPHLTRLVLKIVPDRNTELLLFQTHAVDVVDYLTDDQAAQRRDVLGTSLIRTEKNHLAYASFQLRRAPTDDPRVRRAIAESIQRNEIARKVYHGLWPLATTEIAPVLWGHDRGVRAPAFDLAAAARDFDAAGWHLVRGIRTKNGRPLTIDVAYEASNQGERSVAIVIQENLERVGVTADVRGYPTNVFYAVPDGTYYGGRFNLAISGFYGGADPEQSEFWTCDRVAPNGPNVARYCTPAYDALFNAQSQLVDRSARSAEFARMQRELAGAAVFLPLVYRGDYSAANPAVRGWAPNMLFEFSNADEWDLTR